MSLLVRAAESSEDLDGIAGWAVDLMEAIGAPGAGLAIALENLFPPLPSEVILPLAGFTASRGNFSLFEAILWTTLGSVVGAFALYALGAWLGGLVIAAGWGYTAPSWVGAGLSVLGAGVLGLSLLKHRSDTRPAPAPAAPSAISARTPTTSPASLVA